MNDQPPEYWMNQALELAKKAGSIGEVPIGAIVVKNGQIVGRGHNLREQSKDATRHAEMDAIKDACNTLGAWRLSGCDLYVTLEPCLMCSGAIYQARIDRVFYGASDPKAGAMGSLYQIHQDLRLNHRLPAQGGLLAQECGQILKDFFQQRRNQV
ncbi:tRNA-specific adenosine deaminase [Planctomyces bekefii]|uniref:tRNA-specific adenosine deaminase n=1 Tax=Planctomyces bekefii TaxID=1653850 RepID=A0A5C6MHY8_9PLAN|nr:tRNA-specific adenosine deaminase [Planctomyces bekefii]